MTQAEQVHSPEQEQNPLQNMITVTSVPAKLTVNFEALREALQKEVARYDVVVTADTVTDARKLAAELNATANEIDKRRKEEVAKASEPLRQFDERMRDLVTLCKNGRAKITQQIERFDDEVRETAQRLLAQAREDSWTEMEVADEFRRAEFDDLVMVSAVTKAGSLAGKQKTILQNRCREDKMMQDRTERRLLELENASLRAGLSAPLTRDHVEHFLFADNERYSRELERILTAEVQRQEQAERAMRERLEREARQKAEAEERERKRKAAEAEAERAREEARNRHERDEAERRAHGKCDGNHGAPRCADPECWQGDEKPAEPQPRPAAKTGLRRVVAQFEVNAPAGVSDADLVSECRRVMEAAGITTLTDVYVVQGKVSGGQVREDAA